MQLTQLEEIELKILLQDNIKDINRRINICDITCDISNLKRVLYIYKDIFKKLSN